MLAKSKPSNKESVQKQLEACLSDLLARIDTKSSDSGNHLSQETSLFKKVHAQLNEMKEVQLALEESNEKLAAKIKELDSITHYLISILCNISQGLLFIDLQGNVTTYNAAMEKILEVEPQRVLFKKFWSNFDDKLFGFSIREALAHQESPETLFVSLNSPFGKHYELEINTTFISDETHSNQKEDSMQGIIILVRDITEIKRLQLIAKRNSRMKVLGEMAATVAHEIRNPLGGIKGFASLLERDLADKPSLKKMATAIVEGTDSLDQLVTQVLNYSRPLQPHFESMDLVKLLQELSTQMLADSAVKNRIEIFIETPLSSLSIQGDIKILRSAFLNLLINAVQAIPQKGHIILRINQTDTHAVVQIEDSGIGIPSENLEKIFSPFFTTRPDGNGFGLAEVYKAVEVHGGEIEVRSIIQKYTEFTLKLPLKAYK